MSQPNLREMTAIIRQNEIEKQCNDWLRNFCQHRKFDKFRNQKYLPLISFVLLIDIRSLLVRVLPGAIRHLLAMVRLRHVAVGAACVDGFAGILVRTGHESIWIRYVGLWQPLTFDSGLFGRGKVLAGHACDLFYTILVFFADKFGKVCALKK